MNLGSLDVHLVQYGRPEIQRVGSFERRNITSLDVRLEADRSPSLTSTVSSSSYPGTVIRWQTPPSRPFTPQQSSEDSFHSQDPLQSEATARPERYRNSVGANDVAFASDSPLVTCFDDEQIRSSEAERDGKATRREGNMDALFRESSPPTPVDDTPYIRFAIDQLTRDEDVRPLQRHSTPASYGSECYPVERIVANDGLTYMTADQEREAMRLVRKHRSSPAEGRLFAFNATRPLSYSEQPGDLNFPAPRRSSNPEIFIPVDLPPNSLARDLTMIPFTLMAMDDVGSRTGALFLGIFPRSMLWPRWDGPFSIKVASLFLWVSVFTIPLQGCLFSAIFVDGQWRWTTVQGVAWTLVAIYLLILVAAIVTGAFFFRRTTGLMWDPRSLADVIALLPSSNCLRDYPGTDVMKNREEIRLKLKQRSDRLGYWRTPNKGRGIFYCVGEEGASIREFDSQAGKLVERTRAELDIENAELYNIHTRFRHIPWFLRNTFVTLWVVAACVSLVALFVVSFLPSTAIRKGFAPRVPVLPNSAGFSPSNFLYSFVPSTIGMFLYLVFQPVDMALRKLQPWAELGKPAGANAQNSLLLDYPACLPLSCSMKALINGHYRIAITSFLSVLFILIPVLAGGIFFPLTTPANVVRMIPNLPSFYIMLVLLVLYLLALLLLIPHRYYMRLPHGVDCLAEIFSFLYGSQILTDAAFQKPKSRADLETRLTGARNGWSPSARIHRNRFAFGIYQGRAGGECLGIERLGRRGTQEMVIMNPR
ncbi:uncharacterized protein L3040_005967 [Drepanopeziza brunnea f. sp. 'multigermtubi']|uniref:uncharacterized protein n=1 Tax=Drepanopeziza brunnea f. sp. 'multigermtubi' TaxID=698441 RepID=UPI002396F2EF|nr:hypothetical protein L3040_005967 [Drepanopeziza brunnea f. sp. 'multigermtubi']